MQGTIGDIAQRGRLAIYLHQIRAVSLGRNRHRGRRVDKRRGADREKQLGRIGGIKSPVDRVRRKQLSEPDYIRPDFTPALTSGNIAPGNIDLPLEWLTAVKTFVARDIRIRQIGSS